MNNYPTYRLSEICKISTGKWDANHAVENGRYRFYTCSNKFTMCDTASFNGECVIVPGNGDLGLLFYYNGEFDAYQRTYVLSDIKIYPKYLYYHMVYKWRNSTEKLNYGSTIKYVRITNFTSYEIDVPDIEIQHAIVSRIETLFAELDKAVQHLRTAQQQLKTYRQAVLNHWLNNEDGKWEMVKLGEVAEIKRGRSKHRPRNDKSLFGGKYPFIQTGEIREANGGTITTYTQTYSEKGLEQSRLWPKGTLCLTIAANIAETAYLGFDACFPDSVVGILAQEDKLNLDYFNFFIQLVKQEIENKASATAQKNINVDFLENLNISLPPLAEQQRIVKEIESRLSQASASSAYIENALQQAEALRQSILKKAFSGELV